MVLVVVAVAHRRLGPSSSATTSTTERALPSLAVQLRRSNFTRRVWLPATRAAGVEGLRFHDLRHTAATLAATLAVAAGASTRELMVRMGHSSPLRPAARPGCYEAAMSCQIRIWLISRDGHDLSSDSVGEGCLAVTQPGRRVLTDGRAAPNLEEGSPWPS